MSQNEWLNCRRAQPDNVFLQEQKFFKKTNKKTDETSLLTKIDEGFWLFWLHFSDLDAMFIFYTDGLWSDCKNKPSYIEVEGENKCTAYLICDFGKQFPDGFIGQIAGLKWHSVQHEVPTLIWPHGFKGTSWNLCSLVEMCMIYRLLWGSFAFHLGSPLLELSP